MPTLTVELPFYVDPEEARLLLTMKLFEEGKITAGKAAEMAGYTKRTYLELLGKRGIPIYNYPAEDLARDLANLEQTQEGEAQEQQAA